MRRVVDVEGAVGCVEEPGMGGEVWMEMWTGGVVSIWLVFKAWRLRGDDHGSKSLGAGQ